MDTNPEAPMDTNAKTWCPAILDAASHSPLITHHSSLHPKLRAIIRHMSTRCRRPNAAPMRPRSPPQPIDLLHLPLLAGLGKEQQPSQGDQSAVAAAARRNCS